ncbi:MAG: ABC transporter substrate-binding protein [Desertimonas sp.]
MRTRIHRKIALPITAALAATAWGAVDVAADSPASTDTTEASEASEAGGECPSEGGTVTIGDSGEFRGFDPLITTSSSGTTGAATLLAVYDALIYWNYETGEYEPWVAASLEPDDELVEWTIGLREGVTFGNGDPVTAEAVKASIERHQSDLNVTPTKAGALAITEIEVVDDLTVVLTMDAPTGGVPTLLAGGVGMITNPAIVDELSQDEFNLGVEGAGIGAFEPERFAPGEETVLTAKDNYWAGPVCVDGVRFVGVPDQDARFDAFMLDEFDIVPLRGMYTEIEEEVKPAELPLYTEVRNASGVLFMNGGLPLSDPHPLDERLRRAIAMSIDPVALDQRINNGYGLPSGALVHERSTLYSGAEGLAYDPDAAKELVEEVRAEGEWDGSVDLQCTELGREGCIAIEAALVSVGIEVNVEIVTIGGVLDMFSQEDRNFDLIAWSFSMSDQRPYESLTSGLRTMGYDDEVLNELLSELQRTPDLSGQQEIMASIQERWNEIVPTANFAATGQSWVWQQDIHGLAFTLASIVRLDGVWID